MRSAATDKQALVQPRKAIVPYVGSMSFDGVDDFGQCPIIPDLRGEYAVTVAVSNFVPGTNRSFIDQRFEVGTRGGFTFRTETTTGNIRVLRWRGDGSSVCDSRTSLGSVLSASDKNVRLTFVWRNGEIFVFKNEVPVPMGSMSTTTSSTSEAGLFLAHSKVLNTFSQTKMAQARIYLVGLTDAEVAQLHLTNRTPYDNDPSICVLNLETTAHKVVGDQWLDKSGNNNHATITGATFSYQKPSQRRALLGAPWQIDGRHDGTVEGGVTIEDKAMVFDGVSPSRVDCGENNLVITDATWSIFVRPSVLNSNIGIFTDYSTTGGGQRSWAFSIGGTTGLLRLLMSSTGASATLNTLTSNFNFDADEWQHLLIVKDGTNVYVYKNNVLMDTVTGAPATLFQNSYPIYLGFYQPTSGFLTGDIASATIHNRPLTPEERTAIYNAGRYSLSPVRDGLVAEWSGRDYLGTPEAPTKIFDTASWHGDNVLEDNTRSNV